MASVLGYKAHRKFVQLLRRIPRKGVVAIEVYDRLLRKFSYNYVGMTYFDAKMQLSIDDFISRRIFHFGVWEPNNSFVVEQLLAPGDVFLDVGANIGYYSLLASKLVGPLGRVVAVEASPKTFGVLCKNIQLNNAKNINAVNVAASDAEGHLTLYEESHWNRGASSTELRPGFTPEAVVRAVPLEQLVEDVEMSRLKAVKIDIEGGEARVLSRLCDVSDAWPHDLAIIVEMAPKKVDQSSDLFRRILQEGFQPFAIHNDYSMEGYMQWRDPRLPVEIREAPAKQTDIVFARGKCLDIIKRLSHGSRPVIVQPGAGGAWPRDTSWVTR